jgi:hypothetical protein
MANMHKTAIFLKTVMLEAQKEYSDVQKTKAAKQTFAIMCDTLWSKATERRAFEQLGLEAPLKTLGKDLFMKKLRSPMTRSSMRSVKASKIKKNPPIRTRKKNKEEKKS